MGLDMYLRATKHVSGYEFRGEEARAEYEKLVEFAGAKEIVDPETPSATIEFVVAYWRKANQIHQWFVDNVQEGVDDCKSYYVDRAQLADLKNLCQKVLDHSELVEGQVKNGESMTPEGWVANMEDGKTIADPAVAQELLPTQEGFFFGGTGYDQWYYEDLKSTVEQLERVLAAPDSWDFEYRSSW